MERRIRLTKAAEILDVNPWTLRRAVYRGEIPHVKSDSGRVFIPESWIESQTGGTHTNTNSAMRCAIYARESSSENKTALKSQSEILKTYASARGYQIVHVVEEYASGVNDKRQKLTALLQKKDFDVLLVEHKDRLTRFGFNWFEVLSPFRIEVVNQAEDATHDLMDDLVAILTSFSARLYGQRRGKTKSLAAIEALQNV